MNPIKTTNFGLAMHKMQQFYASVDGKLTAIELTDPALWVHIAPQCRMGDIIWADADDYSFTALLKVTYTAGSRMRCKIVAYTALDVVDAEAEAAANDPYFIKMMGIKKWCVIERSTAEIKLELIPTKIEAMKRLDDYIRALAA